MTSSADDSTYEDIRIENFDLGMHLVGVATPPADILQDVFVDTVRIGLSGLPPSPSVNNAIHLDGIVGNIHFTNYHLAAMQSVIISDGPGVNGADASFTEGTFNTTKTPGIAAVRVSSSDGIVHVLTINGVQDWETAAPLLELGLASRVAISNVASSGDAWPTTPRQPQIHILPGALAQLMISNSIFSQPATDDMMLFEDTNSIVLISNSFLYGRMNFAAATHASITGNWCQNAWVGNLSYVRATGNQVNCPDR